MRKNIPIIKIDDSAKEVFFHIGLTFFSAQEFEECLLSMLVGFHVTENSSNWQKKTENLNSKSLGMLLKEARKITSFDQDVDETLELALKQRNKFIHRYYYETCGLLSDPRCYQKIIDELSVLQNLFKKASSAIQLLSHELILKTGMTEQQLMMRLSQAVRSQVQEKLKSDCN
ncbi:MAG: hypothetical protein KGQ36_05810 [Rickettsiales bacterium]|nr:hypothetical protein [Rickettsiales bacterium]